MKASRWEILGAWLRIWTPSRDVEIPPGPPRTRARTACLAITSQTAAVSVGQPFVAAGSLRDGRFSWCHENPRPAEGAFGTGVAVPLPATCSA